MSDSEKTEPPPSLPPEAKPAMPPGPPPALTAAQGYVPGTALQDISKEEIERELEAAMGGLSAKELYGELKPGGRKEPPQEGPKIGKVIRVHGPDVFVSVPGGRSEGLLPVMQFPDGPPAIGTEVEIQIEGYDQANGLLILNRKGAVVSVDWSSVAYGMTVEARVTATNKGGLEVDVNGIRGFMPISQIDIYRVENAEQFVNQKLRCQVTEVKPAEKNLVVSRRALLEKEREENREKLWEQLAEGQIRPGVVRTVRDFGAFVDLGGVDGLLHVSDLSWSRVEDAAAVVQPGQTIQVQILKIDREKRKLNLGLKQLQASPWEGVAAKFPIGTVVAGKVTKLMEFGAFVELEPGMEGLIHISELAPQRVRRVGDIVQPAQVVQVKVLNIDLAQRRISLSLKGALPEAPVEEAEEEEETPSKPVKKSNVPLRGGIGDQ